MFPLIGEHHSVMSRRHLIGGIGAVVSPCSGAHAWTHGSTILNLNARIVYIGDSITGLGNWNNYGAMADIISGGRYYTPNGFIQGVSGNTSAQILARLPNALALNPAVLVVEGGVNDGFDNWAETNANLGSIYSQTLAAGVRVVALTIFPGPGNVDNPFVNPFIRSYPGISVADCTPGFDNATMTYDGLHPNLVGALFVGNIVAQRLESLISSASIFSVTAGQLLSNPTMSGSITPPSVGGNVVGTGVIPTGFRLYENGTNFTTSMVGTQDTATNGANEQIITIANGPGGTAGVVFDFPGITINSQIGDLFESWCEFDVTQSNGFMAARMFFGGGSIFPTDTTDSLQVVNGVYRTMPTALGSGSATGNWEVDFVLAASGTCQVKIHNLMTRKVPGGQ